MPDGIAVVPSGEYLSTPATVLSQVEGDRQPGCNGPSVDHGDLVCSTCVGKNEGGRWNREHRRPGPRVGGTVATPSDRKLDRSHDVQLYRSAAGRDHWGTPCSSSGASRSSPRRSVDVWARIVGGDGGPGQPGALSAPYFGKFPEQLRYQGSAAVEEPGFGEPVNGRRDGRGSERQFGSLAGRGQRTIRMLEEPVGDGHPTPSADRRSDVGRLDRRRRVDLLVDSHPRPPKVEVAPSIEP